MTHESEYGAQPFERVVKAEFDLKGMDSMKQAAQLQYKLMLHEAVLQVHVDYPRKIMSIIYAGHGDVTQEILNDLQPVKAVLKSRELVDYDSIVRESYHGK